MRVVGQGAQPGDEGAPVHFRHHVVDEDEIEARVLQPVEGLDGICEGFDFAVVELLQDPL